MTDVAALIAPRPLLIAQADHDGIFRIESVRVLTRKLRRLYELLGAESNVSLVETPGPHSYHEKSRTRIFSLFLRELAGKNISPDRVGDIEQNPDQAEPFETLRVLADSMPADAITGGIQDRFVKTAPPPTSAASRISSTNAVVFWITCAATRLGDSRLSLTSNTYRSKK